MTVATSFYVPNAKQQFFNGSGAPLANGYVNMYVPGTTTPKNTWQDAFQTTLNPNPIILDSNGEAVIYGTGDYRQQVYDRNSTLWYDQVVSSNGSSGVLLSSNNLSDVVNPATALANLGGASLPATPQVVAIMAALRLILPTVSASTVYLAGYNSSNDGGGGMFTWNATSSSTDNAGTVINPTGNVGNGRWIRLTQGQLYDVRWFGAKGDGTTNDYTAIQAAITASEAAFPGSYQPGGGIYAAPGYLYAIGTGLVINNPITVDFRSFITYTPTTGTALTICAIAATNGAQSFDMHFSGLLAKNGNTGQPTSVNASGTTGIKVNSMSFSFLRVDAIQGFTNIGIYLDGFGDVFSPQVIQHNTINLGQVVNNGIGLQMLSLNAATSSAEGNQIGIQDIYQNFTCVQVDNASYNASTSNTFNIQSMDDSGAGGGLLMNGQWNVVTIGYTGTNVVMGSNSGFNTVFIGNNFSTSASVGYGGSNNKVVTAWPATGQLPANGIAVADNTVVQNNYGVPIMVYFSVNCNAATSAVITLGPTNTPANTILNPAATGSTEQFPVSFMVPPGWYWKIVKSGAVSYGSAAYIPV